MPDVFGPITGALQISAQIITLAIKIRESRRAPESIKRSAETVENAGRHFRQIAVLVYEALLEKVDNPNYDVHPDLQKTFEVSNEVLNDTYTILSRSGL